MQLNQQNQPQDFGQPPGGHPGGEQAPEDEQDEGGGDESDDMAAEDQGDQQQEPPQEQDAPPQDGGDEQQFGKGGKPGGEGLHRKVVTDKNGHQTTHWVRDEPKTKEGESAHGGREAFNKAKADGRTNLNYSQWAQVRTPNFKRWFGDWAAPAELVAKDSATRDEAEAALKAIGKKPMRNADTGITAFVNRDQRDKILSTDARHKSALNGFTEGQHYAIASMVESLWRHAVLVGDFDDAKNNDKNMRIKRFASAALVDGKARYVTLLAKETIADADGHRVYTLEVHAEKTLRGTLGDLITASGKSTTPSRSVGSIMAAINAKVNGSDVSGLVDRDTGEPMVVYHGGGDFKQIIAGGRFGEAIFVKEGGASGYGDAQYPLFLRGKVLELDEMADALAGDDGRAALASEVGSDLDDDVLDAIADALTDGSHYPDDERVMEAIGAIDEADAQLEIQRLRGRVARALGYTAVRTPDEFDGDSLMVVSASAIKSAVGNNGNFDEREADITKAEQFGPITKAIGMPPVIRISLPGVEDEARQ